LESSRNPFGAGGRHPLTSIVNDRFGRDVTVGANLDVNREAQQYVS
jgi:hypothetical protein